MGNEVRFHSSLDAKGVLGPLAQIEGKFQKLKQQGASGILGGIAAGATVAGINALENSLSGVINFAEGAVTAASNLNETVNKSQVVFGESSKDIEAWGKTAATAMGLSENAAIGAASSIGNLLLSTGTAQEKIAPMSKAIVQLASDLASFNNISTDDALAKLQSGLVGQERPLRELGVAISAASVDAEAAAEGFQKVNGQFTEGQKVQARYALIFKQTTTAQGDFARTSNALANSQRIVQAEWDDAIAALGQALIPAITGLAHITAQELIPALVGAAKGIGDVGDSAYHALVPVVDFLNEIHKALGGSGGPPRLVEDLGDTGKAFAKLQVTASQASGSVVADLNRMSAGTKNSATIGIQSWAAQVTKELNGVKDLGKETDAAFVSGLKSGQSAIDSEWDDILNGLKHPQARAKQIAHDIGILTSKSLKEAIQSGNPEQAATARDLVQTILTELDALKVNSRDIGTKGMQFLRNSMKDSNPEIARAARSIFETIQSNINLPKKAYSWGRALADGAALGLGSDASKAGFEAAARKLMAAAIDGLGAPTPKPGAPSPKPHPKPKPGGGSYDPNNTGIDGGVTGDVFHHVITVNVAGGVMTPAAARELGQAIGPAVTVYQQRQGILPRTGTAQRG